MADHRFAVGQTVRLLQSMINRGKSIHCEIMQIMPFDGVSSQYRIRGENERFDRIAQEHELAEITAPEGEAGQPAPSERSVKSISAATFKGKQ